ncbi:hypothetical protein [Streptomyces sp. NPDC047028]|uniref:hypothetical protein n=1 Tax=Streptomyces sp. NPDC047028 TaxID=3155793 RepID=UPI0033CCA311
MHRTTTTAALLVTVAVSALTGCVTVQRPAAPAAAPDSAPVQPSAPRPDGSTEPRVVQAPAQEALEMVGPHREQHASGHRAAPGPPAARRPPAPPAHPRPRPEHPEHSRHTRVEVPHLPHPVPTGPDVCALGKKYGGWHPDSPEAVICKQAYGR